MSIIIGIIVLASEFAAGHSSIRFLWFSVKQEKEVQVVTFMPNEGDQISMQVQWRCGFVWCGRWSVGLGWPLEWLSINQASLGENPDHRKIHIVQAWTCLCWFEAYQKRMMDANAGVEAVVANIIRSQEGVKDLPERAESCCWKQTLCSCSSCPSSDPLKGL